MRDRLGEIEPGHRVVVHLHGRRVGRLGTVVRVAIDKWDPLVPPTRTKPDGEMGRRILVRWDLDRGGHDPDRVLHLPEPLPRANVCMLGHAYVQMIEKAAKDPANWVPLPPHRFAYERAISDFIATYPHVLEDGLQPYPNAQVREQVFGDGSRSDVLLMDRDERPVVVECKQGDPSVASLRQLRRYMDLVGEETRVKPRGILVHGGASKLSRDVRRELAQQRGQVEVLRYHLRVDFELSK